jgi:hypothetical protein
MGLFKKIADLFSGGNESTQRVQEVEVRCNRCRELLTARIDLNQQLSEADDGGYLTRKVLVGSGRCFQRIEVTLYFDDRRNLIDRQISGGQFVDPEPDPDTSPA